MFSLTESELEAAKKCVAKVSNRYKVVAACVYGSKAAGYARPNSDIDLLVALEGYPFAIKYAYMKEGTSDISLLIVSKNSLEADARRASLGEFAIGRLLHVYEPIINGEFLHSIERAYKKRVILEELQDMVDSTSLLATEILFPLEYVVFSRIKKRISRYPNATYSYYRTYARSPSSAMNLHAALRAYRDALDDILLVDSELFSRRDTLLQISDKAIFIDKGKVRLKLASRLQQVSAYIVHTYAGREVMHLMVKEAESKIKRRVNEPVHLPDNMAVPRKTYWRLEEGELFIDSDDWLDELATRRGLGRFSISHKRRLGNMNSRTMLYVLRHSGGDYKVVVKGLAKTKSMKWAALSLWTSPVKRFKVGPLFRLATEYKGIRFLRSLGIATPKIEAIVLDEKLLVTSFIEGKTMADVIKNSRSGGGELDLLRTAGSQIAKIHNAGASFGNIKPKNIIVNGTRLFFTDTEQFLFSSKDQVWDLAQFICWDLKGTRNIESARTVVTQFLQGYSENSNEPENIAQLAKSRRYIESFFPLLSPPIAQAIKDEARRIAG